MRVCVYYHKDICRANERVIDTIGAQMSPNDRVFFYNDDFDNYARWDAYAGEGILVLLTFRARMQMSTFFEISSGCGRLKIPNTNAYRNVVPKDIIVATDIPFLSWWPHTYEDTRTLLYNIVVQGYCEV